MDTMLHGCYQSVHGCWLIAFLSSVCLELLQELRIQMSQLDISESFLKLSDKPLLASEASLTFTPFLVILCEMTECVIWDSFDRLRLFAIPDCFLSVNQFAFGLFKIRGFR